MPGTALQRTLTLTVPAAATTGIAASQSGTGGTSLTINGTLASGGVANLVTAQRVIITPAGAEATKTFTITGTDRYGRPQTEVLQGVNNPTVAQTAHDFLTVKSIVPSANTASTVTAGTVGVASTDVLICDAITNPANFSCAVTITGTVNYTIQESYDDLAPAWDQAANTINWFPDTNFTSQAANKNGVLNGPFTMIRLTINSGSGTATARILMSFVAGPR